MFIVSKLKEVIGRGSTGNNRQDGYKFFYIFNIQHFITATKCKYFIILSFSFVAVLLLSHLKFSLEKR